MLIAVVLLTSFAAFSMLRTVFFKKEEDTEEDSSLKNLHKIYLLF